MSQDFKRKHIYWYCWPVFTLNDDGVSVAISTEVPEELLDAAAEAKANCPVEAIVEK